MLILQALDIENFCQGIYDGNSLKLEPQSLPSTGGKAFAWKHTPLFKDDENYTYLFVALGDRSLSDYSSNTDFFKKSHNTLQAQRKAMSQAKIEIEDFCFFDALPKHQLMNWLSVRHEALHNLCNGFRKPDCYDILHKGHVLTENISKQKVSFAGQTRHIKYNIFGSATGRLTTKKDSVPILTMKKEDRSLLKPTNGAFVEIDMNAAEVRTLMALGGHDLPKGDIHQHLQNEIFPSTAMSRSSFKEKLFAWLYNPSSVNRNFDSYFSRDTFKNFFDENTSILTTPFGRRLLVPERKAQNYLLQSTTSDLVIENAYKIQKILEGKKTKIAFTLHDSIVLDMPREEAKELKEIKSFFEKTRLGIFSSTCKIGKDFGNLKEIKI